MSRFQTVYAISSQGYFNTSRPSNHPTIIRANQRNIHLGFTKCNQIFKGQSYFKEPQDEENYKASRSMPAKSYMARSQITDAQTNNLDQSSRNGHLLTPNIRQIKRTKTLVSRSVHFGSSVHRVQRSSESGSSHQKSDKPIYDFEQTMKIKIPLNISQFDSFKSEALHRQVSTPHFNNNFHNRNHAAMNLHLNSQKIPQHKTIKNLSQAARLENSYHSNTSSSIDKSSLQNTYNGIMKNSYNEQIDQKIKMVKGQNKLAQFNHGNSEMKYNSPVTIKFNKVVQDKYKQPTVTTQYYKKDQQKPTTQQPIKFNQIPERIQNKFQSARPTVAQKPQNTLGVKRVQINLLNRNLQTNQSVVNKQPQPIQSKEQHLKNQNNYKITQSRYYQVQYKNNGGKQTNSQINNTQSILTNRSVNSVQSNIASSRILQPNNINLRTYQSNTTQQNKQYESQSRSYQAPEQNNYNKMSQSRIKISSPVIELQTPQQKDSRKVINLIPSSYYTEPKKTIEYKKSETKPFSINNQQKTKIEDNKTIKNQNRNEPIKIQVPNTSINIKKSIKIVEPSPPNVSQPSSNNNYSYQSMWKHTQNTTYNNINQTKQPQIKAYTNAQQVDDNKKSILKSSIVIKNQQKINNSQTLELSQLNRLRQQLAKKQRELRQCKNSLQMSEKKNKSLQIQVKKLQTGNQVNSQNRYSLVNYPTSSNYNSQKNLNDKQVGASAFLYLTLFIVLLAKDMTGR